jgi:hypothetical protein
MMKTSNSVLSAVVLFITGLALISLASPSYAAGGGEGAGGVGDYKLHPGSKCQPSLGSESGDVIRGPGFIYNTNPNKTLSVTCPILRDNIIKGTARFSVRLDTARQSIQCRLFALNVDGAELFSSTKFTDPNLSISSLHWDITAEQTSILGTYSINCELPVNVFLLSYFIQEEPHTDGGV